jgi:hypothetical protein
MDCEVTLTEDESGIVAFLARQGEEVRLLYTHPDRTRAGTQLAGSKRWSSSAFKLTPVPVAFTKRAASVSSALPMGRTTRKKRPMFATGRSAPFSPTSSDGISTDGNVYRLPGGHRVNCATSYPRSSLIAVPMAGSATRRPSRSPSPRSRPSSARSGRPRRCAERARARAM